VLCRSASNRNELFFGPVDELPQGPSIVAPSSQPPAADGTHGVSNTEQVQQLLVRAFRKHKVYGKRSTEVESLPSHHPAALVRVLDSARRTVSIYTRLESRRRAMWRENGFGQVGRFVGETHEGVVTAKSALRPSWKLLESSRMTRVPTTRSIPVAQGPAPCTVAYDTQQCDQVCGPTYTNMLALSPPVLCNCWSRACRVSATIPADRAHGPHPIGAGGAGGARGGAGAARCVDVAGRMGGRGCGR